MAQRRSRSQRLDKKIFYLANQIMMGIMIDDLTAYRGDAIVNAANERMLGGGGVDGAIHRAAGRGLKEACYKVPEVTPGVRCPTGEARITPGFDLPAKFVIHTVGPIYASPRTSAPLLEAAFRSSLELASSKNLSSVAFPAISCGVYAYPIKDAARIAVETCMAFSDKQGEGPVKQIDFVLFAPDVYEAWVEAAEELSKGPVTDDGEAAGGTKKKPAAEQEDAAAPMPEEEDSKAAKEDKADTTATGQPDKMEETCVAAEGTSAEDTTAEEGKEGAKAADDKGDDSVSAAQAGDAMSIASTEAEGKKKELI